MDPALIRARYADRAAYLAAYAAATDAAIAAGFVLAEDRDELPGRGPARRWWTRRTAEALTRRRGMVRTGHVEDPV